MTWFNEDDGITRNEQYCVNCSKKNKQAPKKDITFNWKRKRCLKCNNYTTTPLSKFCYKCDPRLQNIKYIKKHEESHPIIKKNKNQNILKIDHIQEICDQKKSGVVKDFFNKNISEDVHNRNDGTV